MSSIIDDAILKLQTHALALTSESIRGAPNHPIEDASTLPLAITYIAEGNGGAQDASTAQMLFTVNVDFHVNRSPIKFAYSQLQNIIPEFIKRLAGDPTLGGTVDTITFPVNFVVQPAQWDTVVTQMASFKVVLKFRKDPIT